MHDKMKDEESRDNLIDEINEYFNLDSLNINDLSKSISECNLDKEE